MSLSRIHDCRGDAKRAFDISLSFANTYDEIKL